MSKCRTCRFRMYLSGIWGCNYGEIMDTPRSLICPAGDACTVYEEGPQRRVRPTLQQATRNRYRALHPEDKKKTAAEVEAPTAARKKGTP